MIIWLSVLSYVIFYFNLWHGSYFISVFSWEVTVCHGSHCVSMAAIVKAAGRPGVVLVFDLLHYQARAGGLRFLGSSFDLNCFGDIFVSRTGKCLSEIFSASARGPQTGIGRSCWGIGTTLCAGLCAHTIGFNAFSMANAWHEGCLMGKIRSLSERHGIGCGQDFRWHIGAEIVCALKHFLCSAKKKTKYMIGCALTLQFCSAEALFLLYNSA